MHGAIVQSDNQCKLHVQPTLLCNSRMLEMLAVFAGRRRQQYLSHATPDLKPSRLDS